VLLLTIEGVKNMPAEAGSEVSQRIMRAAKQLFFARGFADTPLRAIATQAGTSESGVLRIYGSKTGLLRAVYASCWAEINDHVEQAVVAAAEKDPDPRNILLEFMRAVFEKYHADAPMMTFLLSAFGFPDTTGLSVDTGVDPGVDQQVRYEYHRYLNRIQSLCTEIVASRPDLSRAGVSSAAFGHLFTSVIYGTQAGWYMAQQEQGQPVPSVTMEETLAAARFILYPEKFVDS
jgi:AcrR family transcriptional regulator